MFISEKSARSDPLPRVSTRKISDMLGEGRNPYPQDCSGPHKGSAGLHIRQVRSVLGREVWALLRCEEEHKTDSWRGHQFLVGRLFIVLSIHPSEAEAERGAIAILDAEREARRAKKELEPCRVDTRLQRNQRAITAKS